MLHIDERPETWEDFVGNEESVNSLRRSLMKDDRPHVYMITGPSGVGKTTLARIAAKEIGAIGFGLIEKNISDETGVDGARGIIRDAETTPFEGPVKAYILDEIDKASDSWQSAMKKPLEDVPGQTYYFLCTEFPKKIKSAIMTRSVHIDLRPLSDEDMLYLLNKLRRKYHQEMSRAVLQMIVEKSMGSAREAVVTLEQLFGVEDEEEARKIIATNGADPETRDLCSALLKKQSWKEISTLLKSIKQEPESIRYAVLGYMNAVLLNSGKERAFDLIEIFRDSVMYSGKAGITSMCYEATL